MTHMPDINSDLAAQELAADAREAADLALTRFDLHEVDVALRRVEVAVEHLRRCSVRAAVGQGADWEAIADALDITRGEARARYAPFAGLPARITPPRGGT